MHLPLDQCESAADAMISSGEVREPVQVVDLARSRDLLGTHATSAEARDREMVPAMVIEGTFSACS